MRMIKLDTKKTARKKHEVENNIVTCFVLLIPFEIALVPCVWLSQFSSAHKNKNKRVRPTLPQLQIWC